MELILYFKLQTKSRRAIQKTTALYGRTYNYRPRGELLVRLSEETGMTREQVYHQLQRERKYLLEQQP